MRVLHGLPERWVQACPALPFGLLQEAQALVQYVLCGVDVSVAELTADVALHHVLRRQVLNRYEVIVPDKLGGQFMQHVLPLAGNVLLQPRHLDPCLFPALAPFVFRESWRWRRASFFWFSARYLWFGHFRPSYYNGLLPQNARDFSRILKIVRADFGDYIAAVNE